MFKKGPPFCSLLSLLLVLELESHVTSDIDPSYPLPMSGSGGVSVSGSSGETGGSSSNGIVWSPRQVVTKMGTVQGFIVRPPNGYEGVEVFLNLPYATPPEGSLRFMPPVSGSPWKGTRRSETPSPVCPQVLPNIRNESEALKMMPRGRLTYLRRLLPHLRNQSEDCLYLNIYLPAKVAEGKVEGKLLPVMVHVHGEDWGYGGGHPYDPTMLVSQGNIIVVNMNYRLGILGFLNADADGHFKLPFNFALLDQIAALQWVQENIELFGGDRSRVTLMGHGKGAVCVNFLMISNAVPTGLLFHRVILSSGSALSPLTADLSRGPELARKFAKKVKCPMEPSSTMLQCLRELPLKYFLESELWNLFGPTGDGIVVKHSLPSESVIMNRISHYPLIFGVVRAEFLPSLNNHDATYGLESERRRELLRQFIRKHYSFHRNEILAGAIHEYTDWEKPAQHPLNVRDETIDALADAQVVAPLIKIGDLHAASSRTKAYFYVFDYQSKNSEYQQRLGCVSGEDLSYIFGAPLYFYENDYGGNNGGGDMESHHHPVDQPLHHQSPSQQNGMIIPSGKTSASSSSNELHSFFQRKEKWRKRNERMGGLGVFAGNFTWYEVQLSATLIQLWASFIRSGNPNGDIPPKPVVGMLSASSSSSSSSPGGGTYQGRLGMGKGKVKDPGEQLSSEGSEPLHAASGGSGVTTDNNRLRTSRDSEANDNNKLVGSLGPTPLEEPQHQHHLQQHYHQPQPILVEWPEYDSLDKKYLIFDLRPRIRNHYRAHKLSFWLHLVPDYQKNNEGTSAISIHHEMSASVYSMIPPAQNLSRASVIQPTIFASGLHDPGKTRYNSSSAGGKKRSRNHNQGAADGSNGGVPLSPGGDLEERQRQRDSAILHVPSSSSSSSVNPNDPLESPFGFHTYSTALSVTIAIGCSLLILNILIFATFYYEREKRRQEHRRQKPNTEDESTRLAANASNNDDDGLDEPRQGGHRHPSLPRHQSRSTDSSSSAPAGGRGTNFFRQQSSTSNHDTFSIPLTTSSISCGGGGGGGSGSCSASASLKRRRDNGASNNNTNGNIVLHHFPPPPSMEVTTTTVFCEHYVNEEESSSALNAYNELYTSPPSYLEDEEVVPLGLGVEDDDDEEMEVEVVTSMTPPAGSSSSDQHQLLQSCRSDMSYGTYGGGCGSSAGLERGFFPISPAPQPSSSSTAAAAGGTGTNSNSLGGGGSLRQKRKAFAISGGIASGCGGGALNEFSMSDVIVEPVTNVPNFSPQSSPKLGEELFEIERIPTVEELIGADPSNPNLMPTTISLPMSSNCSRNDGGSRSSSSIATVIVCPAPPPLSSSDCDFLQST